MIEAKNLVYEYPIKDENGNVESVFYALNGVDIRINDGEFVAVLGANGSGKSTFAKHLNVLLRPTRGTLRIDGADAADLSNEYLIRSGVGMVFQNPDNQIIANVVEEDVGFGPENLAVPTDEIKKRVTECLEAADIEEFRGRSPSRLSGGQKQRVSIAGILAMKPGCIVLDEPTAMLDPQGRKNIINIVKQINKQEKITVILITHYMEEVIDADRIYVMKEGKAVLSGTPREVFSRTQEIASCNLEVPIINQLVQELRSKGIDIRKDILTEEELIRELREVKKHANQTGTG